MSKYRWYEIHTKLVNGLKKLYEDFDNDMYPNYNYVGEVLFSKCMEREIEFKKLFNWSKNISEESLDPFHIFVSFNNNNTILDRKLERIQFYFDVLKIPYKLKVDEEDSRFQIPHIPVMQLLTNRPKEKQDEIWHAFINVIVNDNIEDIFKYKEWYGIAFTVVTEFLFWINSSKYLSLDSNTEKLLLKYGLINNKIKTSNDYINLIKIKNDTFTDDIFRLIVKFSYDNQNPKSPEDHSSLFDFLQKTNNRKIVIPKVKELRKYNEDYKYNLERINNQFVGLKIKETCKFDVKNLDSSTYYKFNDLFDFRNNNDEEIFYDKKSDIDMYSFYDERGNKKFSFNVNAIVGKNGTGKSSLIELFFMGLNNLFKKSTGNMYLKEVNGLELELFIFNSNLFKIDIGEEVKIYEYSHMEDDDKNLFFSIEKEINFDDFFNDNEFFSCIFNYSLHSFNNYDNKNWLTGIFSNDSFDKRKIQIEPKRTFGNIEIKSEVEKLKQKLSFFLLNNNIVKNKQLSKNQTIEEIVLNLESDKFTNPIDFNEDIDEFNFLRDYLKDNFKVCPETIAFENIKIKKTYYPQEIKDESIEFILFLYIKDLSNKFDNLEEVIKDKSLEAYEFRRAIYNLKYITELGLTRETKTIKINEFAVLLNDILIKEKEKNQDIELMDITPCSKFYIDYLFKEGNSFSNLSSGEKQKIFITTSIAYYLKNLDKLGYKNANIFLDEIELYFHPQMQRDFLYDLHEIIFDLVNNEYEGFKVLRSVNFIFVTHSPFILSDLPDTYILKLNNGNSNIIKNKTFAANIYDLLKDDFFLDDGFIGKFADVKIKDVINLIRIYNSTGDDLPTNLIDSFNRFTNRNIEYINNSNLNEINLEIEKLSDKMRKIVSYIGESILRKKLLDDLDLLFPKDGIDLKYKELKTQKFEDIELKLKELDEETKISLIKKLLR